MVPYAMNIEGQASVKENYENPAGPGFSLESQEGVIKDLSVKKNSNSDIFRGGERDPNTASQPGTLRGTVEGTAANNTVGKSLGTVKWDKLNTLKVEMTPIQHNNASINYHNLSAATRSAQHHSKHCTHTNHSTFLLLLL